MQLLEIIGGARARPTPIAATGLTSSKQEGVYTMVEETPVNPKHLSELLTNIFKICIVVQETYKLSQY